MDWGQCYFDHFAGFLRPPIGREVFSQGKDAPTIQILSYDSVFDGCRTFASLGLSHYADAIGSVAEVLVPVDAGWDAVPSIVANALFYLVQNRLVVAAGTVVGGISTIDAVFAKTHGKEALYLTDPYDLPDGAATVACAGRVGQIYLGIFLSPREYQLRRERGAHALEAFLEESGVDPYHVMRE